MLRPTIVLPTNSFPGIFLVVLENLFNFAKSTNLSKKKDEDQTSCIFHIANCLFAKGNTSK